MPHTIADHPQVRALIDVGLAEDLPYGDLTTEAVLKGTEYAEAVARAKARGVVAGLPVFRAVFERVDPGLGFEPLCDEGDHVEPGGAVAQVAGCAASILRAERLALNFLQHMSGIATATFEMVKAVSGTGARIVDTRKTVPGMRAPAKYAVRMGGGLNHRFGLSDGVLIKDNHIHACGSIRDAVERARARAPHLTRVEVECALLEQIPEALDAGADAVLLDNMSPEMLRKAVALVGGRAITEASGGVSLSSVRAIAETGVDLISCGAITHSAPALDIALIFEDPEPPAERRLQRVR